MPSTIERNGWREIVGTGPQAAAGPAGLRGEWHARYTVSLPRLQHAFLEPVWFFSGFAVLFALHRGQVEGPIHTLAPLP